MKTLRDLYVYLKNTDEKGDSELLDRSPLIVARQGHIDDLQLIAIHDEFNDNKLVHIFAEKTSLYE